MDGRGRAGRRPVRASGALTPRHRTHAPHCLHTRRGPCQHPAGAPRQRACRLAGPCVASRERRGGALAAAAAAGGACSGAAPAASQACARMPSMVMRCAARPTSICRTCARALRASAARRARLRARAPSWARRRAGLSAREHAAGHVAKEAPHEAVRTPSQRALVPASRSAHCAAACAPGPRRATGAKDSTKKYTRPGAGAGAERGGGARARSRRGALTPGPSGGKAPPAIAANSAAVLAARKGSRPVASSYRITPRLHTSMLGPSYSCARAGAGRRPARALHAVRWRAPSARTAAHACPCAARAA